MTIIVSHPSEKSLMGEWTRGGGGKRAPKLFKNPTAGSQSVKEKRSVGEGSVRLEGGGKWKD